jgi:hypothetical protein
MKIKWWSVAVFIILLHVLAQWAGHIFENKAPLGVASISTGIVVFMWLLFWGGWEKGGQMTKEACLRAAIAGGIVTQYLSLVATVTFFPGGQTGMLGITEAFVTSFTAVVTVVIAFYFSTSAYIESKKSKSEKTTDDDA